MAPRGGIPPAFTCFIIIWADWLDSRTRRVYGRLYIVDGKNSAYRVVI